MQDEIIVYPESVELRLEAVIAYVEANRQSLQDDLTLVDKSFDGIVIDNQSIRDAFGPILLDSWIDGEQQPPFTDDEMFGYLQLAAAISVLKKWEDLGVVGTFTDELEEEFLYLTELGKTITSKEDLTN